MATTKKTTVSRSAKPKVPASKPKTTSKSPRATPKATKVDTKAPVTAVRAATPQVKVPAPTVVSTPVPVVVGPALRKKEIIEEVVNRSGLKKRDIKPVLDQLLAVMGEGLDAGRELVVPPFGRIKVHKQKTTPKKKIYFAKVHQNTTPPSES